MEHPKYVLKKLPAGEDFVKVVVTGEAITVDEFASMCTAFMRASGFSPVFKLVVAREGDEE